VSHFRPWPYPRILAHRGGGTLAPENTLAAIRFGHGLGFRAVEFDAMLAGDGVPVLIHDHTLERTTSGRGLVAEHTAAQLGALDAGSWLAPRFAGEPVPPLSSAIELCRALRIWANIEIKPSPGAQLRTGEVVARMTAALYADRPQADAAQAIDPALPLLSSFSAEALAAARDAAPGLPRGYLVDRLPDGWRDELQRLRCVSLHTNHRHLSREQARAVKDAGYWLFCYTVNDPARAREILRWGVDALCTDRIDLIDPAFA
jgi:glycerophosphoryl diester phosphodiesterase